MPDPTPSGDPAARYVVGEPHYCDVYDTWRPDPNTSHPAAMLRVATADTQKLARTIAEALNDREQARANSAADIHAASERRIEDLRVEFGKHRVAVERHAVRLMDQSLGGDVPTGMSWTVWMAMDVVARDVVQRAVLDAIENGRFGHEDYPMLDVNDWDLIARRATALVEAHPDAMLSNAQEAEKFLAERTSNEPNFAEVPRV